MCIALSKDFTVQPVTCSTGQPKVREIGGYLNRSSQEALKADILAYLRVQYNECIDVVMMWSEEDYGMEQEQSQPLFLPPMARIPQIPPCQVAGNRRVYGSPMPETPRSVGAVACPARAITPLSPCADEPVAQTRCIVRASSAPPYRIPAEWRRHAEPGVSETLLGCAVLLLIAFFALMVMYFLFV